ncbi:MAG TPA: M14 family zinc carboxypeptidase [Trebonia sp.]|jgi:hypothetical protein|nr:M14 family zinc carboxypeptidase [Trebonia sp.]
MPPVRALPGDFHYHAYDYAGAAPWALSAPVPSAGNFPFYSLLQDLAGLHADALAAGVPNVNLGNLGAQTHGGRDIPVLSLGNRLNDPNAPAVVITGGIHAREWMAVEFAYLLAEYLISHYVAAPAAVNRYQRTIRNLVDARRIVIIPMLNPDGNDYSVFGVGHNHRRWRKNRRPLPTDFNGWEAELAPGHVLRAPFANLAGGYNPTYDVPGYPVNGALPPVPAAWGLAFLPANQRHGVDLNRNLTTAAWGWSSGRVAMAGAVVYPDGDPEQDSYFGTRPGGEAEAGALQVRLAAIGPVSAAIDYHGYGRAILYPTEAWNTGLVGTGYKALGTALKELVHAPGVRDYQLGSPRQVLGYDGTGSVIDHLAQHRQARAFTIEVDPAWNPADNADAAQAKFQQPEDQITVVFEKNIRGALAVLATPRPTVTRAQAAQHPLRMAKTAMKLLTWDVYGRGNQLPA